MEQSRSIVVENRNADQEIRDVKDDDRDEAFSKYVLSELRAHSENDANILRTRLQRTLLEFMEEVQERNTQNCQISKK